MSVLLIPVLLLSSSSSFAADVINSQPAIQESNAVRLNSGVSENSTKGLAVAADDDGRESTRQSNYNGFGDYGGLNYRRRCPKCDESVFPYCGEKLFHDACCCTDPYQFPLPYKCHLADCAFLHANSCREHRLISNCCCSDEYRSLLRSSGKSDVKVAASTEKKN